jgi:hypothetical protein
VDYVVDFLRHQLLGVTIGEDISCPKCFRIGKKWMLLCISQIVACRYYLGAWDAEAEQFVPEKHGRMNWRWEDQSIRGQLPWRVGCFAPESVRMPVGRRGAVFHRRPASWRRWGVADLHRQRTAR